MVQIRYNLFERELHEIFSWKVLLTLSIILVIILSLFSTALKAVAGSWSQTSWAGGAAPGIVNGTVSTYTESTNLATGDTLSLSPTAGWAAGLNAWSRRTAITVTNSGAIQSNYQIRLSITYDGDMQADFDDIRFTNSVGTLLDYWLDTKVDSTSAVVWVEVDNLAVGANTIYMYYANAAATSATSGTNTFITFDDFEDGVIDTSKWVETDIAANEIVETGGQLRFTRTTNGTFVKAVYSNDTIARSDVAFEFDYIWAAQFNGNDAIMFGWHDGGGGIGNADMVHAFYNPGGGNVVTVNRSVQEDGTTRASITGQWTVGTTYDVRVRLRSAGGAYYDASTDNGVNWTTSYTSAYSTETNLRPAWSFSAGTHRFDNARVRKWMATEPSVAIGAEQNIYVSSGYVVSNVFDAGFANNWGTLSYTSGGTGTVEVKVRSSNDSSMTTATDWSGCTAIPSGNDTTGGCVTDGNRFLQYRIDLVGNGSTTPTLDEVSIQYESTDQTDPITNATNVTLSGITNGAWTNLEPLINWTAGADDGGGAGLLGYCISLDEATPGASALLNPELTAGKLTGLDDGMTQNYCPFIVSTTNVNLANIAGLNLISGKQYYFSIKAVDVAGNVWMGASGGYQDLVSFRYDNTPPTPPGFISLPANFISTKAFTVTWPTVGGDAAADADSGLAGLQYRIGNDGTWFGDGHSGAENLSDLLVNDGAYTTDGTYDYPLLVEGNNYIFVRALDTVGNVSATTANGVVKINTVAPGQVLNLEVAPASNTINSFAFSWDPPTTFTGNVNNITYCYSVNTLPSISTCNFTATGVTSLNPDAFANQPGSNTMYVVARDEANNINYDTYANVVFQYSGTAPGMPVNLDIADISIRATNNWRAALSWDPPTNSGSGISNYRVYRSTTNTTCADNFNAFSSIGASSASSYVDSGLTQVTYYYCVKACDNANNCSASSMTVSLLPTGRFTEPAALISGPTSSNVTSRKATISWSTDRSADSKVQFGIASGNYFTEEVSNSNQTTDHTITINNINPGTTYYYRAKWTDEDGNTGFSTEKTFTTLPPPTVVSLSATDVRVDSAIITFTVRNSTRATVLYGLSRSYGGTTTIATSTEETQYSMKISNLQDGSTYFYRLDLQDRDGVTYEVLQNNQFTTLPRPKVSDIQVQEVANSAQPTVEVLWKSNTGVSSIITFYPEGRVDLSRDEISIEPRTDHRMLIKGLVPKTRYVMFVRGIDKVGNEAKSDAYTFTTATDSRPPEITNLKVGSEISTTAQSTDKSAQLIISWDTDEPSTSQVEYGEGTSNSYTFATQIDQNLSYKHLVVISGLRPSTVYHLRAVSADEVGNQTESTNIVNITNQETQDPLQLVIGKLGDAFRFLR